MARRNQGAQLGVAVVGLGVGRQHALAFDADARCRVLGLFDLDAAQADAVRAEMTGAPAVFESFERILADPAVDVVSIASYDDAHAAEVEAALHAGKHVFVEKPLCRTMDELARIRAAWDAGGRPHLASNLVLRAAPLYRWLKEAVARGDFGEVYAFDGDYLYGRVHKITEGWRRDVDDYSVMEGGGIHLIDIMRETLGAEPVCVRTTGNRIATRETAYRYDDFQAATFRFESGAIGRITANFGCMHRHHHAVRVFGTRQTLIYDDRGPRLFESRDETAEARPLDHDPLPAGKGALIPGFVDAILEGRDPEAQARREFSLVAAVAASDAARRSGGEEKVQPQ